MLLPRNDMPNYVDLGDAKFRLWFALRNPHTGPGWMRQGVHDLCVIDHYAEGFLHTYDAMTSDDYGWPQLADLPLNIYVGEIPDDSYGLAYPGRYGSEPYIWMNRGGDEPRPQDACDRRMAAACHELTHMFQFEYFPNDFQTPMWRNWTYWDEIVAITTETIVFPDILDYFRYLPDWFRHPQTSLDSDSRGFLGVMFGRYLAHCFGPSIFREVYEIGSLEEGNIEAIDALARAVESRGGTLSSTDEESLFVKFACLAYLLDGPGDVFKGRILKERFGERGVTHTFATYPADRDELDDALDHLGVRYFRFRPDSGTSTLKVSVSIPGGDENRVLRCLLFGVDAAGSQALTTVLSATDDGMRASLSDFSQGTLDHAVLVVVNSSYGAHLRDHLPFAISATAE